MDFNKHCESFVNEDLLCMLCDRLNQPRVCIGKAYFICEGGEFFSFKKLLMCVSTFIYSQS